MHDHQFDSQDPLRPKSARLVEEPEPTPGAAAAAGRLDALHTDDLLGLQRSAGNAAVSELIEGGTSPVYDVINSAGRPLEPEVRQDMETRMGQDFGDVRVHDDSAAAESAAAVNAKAYTVGSNIVFQRDHYDPSSTAGRTTLAHELTHVVQQRNGPVDGTESAGGIKVSDPNDRFEREAAANADRVMSSPTAGEPIVSALQRQVDDDTEETDETLQGSFVQRSELDDEVEEET